VIFFKKRPIGLVPLCRLLGSNRPWMSALAICHQPRIAPDDLGASQWEVGCPHRPGERSMILKARQSAAAIVT
jgi:hypothetical protein